MPAQPSGGGRSSSAGDLLDPARLAAVGRVLAGGPVGARLDRLVALAADLVGAPSAQVSLVGDTDQIVVASHGLERSGASGPSPARDSLCTVAVAAGDTLVVPDARADVLVRHLPPVTSGAVGAYAGVRLVDEGGHCIGSLCAFGPQPRAWTEQQLEHLTAVAQVVAAELAAHAVPVPADLGSRASLAVRAAGLGTFLYEFAGGGHAEWDEQMLALHGYSAETFDGTLAAFEAVTHPDDLGRVVQALAHAQDTLGELVAEYRVVLPDGSLRWVRLRGRVMPDVVGRASYVIGAAYDASAELGLRDELSRLMETMPAGLVRIDRGWRFSYVNAVAERIYDRSRSELVGVSIYDAYPELRDSVFDEAYRAAARTGTPSSIEAYFQPLETHFEVRIWPDEAGLTLFFQDVTERQRTQQALEDAGRRLGLLAEAGGRLAGSLQPTEVLDVLVDLLVPDLACSATIAVTQPVAELLQVATSPDPDRLQVVRVKHRDPALEADLRAVLAGLDLRTGADSGLGRAVRTREAHAYERIPDELLRARARTDEQYAQMVRLNTGPQLTLPLVTPSGVVGAMTVGGSRERGLDRVLLTDLAGRAAVALENALLFSRQHQAATVLQRALLPRTALGAPGVLVATRYLPAAEQALAGGDFFKTVRVDGRLVCALGDVMGHGTASAARAGQLHGLVAALALQGCGPGELLGQLAAGVDQMMDLELATLLVCSYDPDTRRLTAATAGHPPPLIAPISGPPSYVDLVPGPPLGVAPATYDERTVDVGAGGTVVLFSDGLVERRGESLTTGLERLRAAVAELRMPPEAVADHVLRRCGVLAGTDDDVALLVLSHP